jgi:2,3-bisphosphoglycerate-independent phosphoglycerate mutase
MLSSSAVEPLKKCSTFPELAQRKGPVLICVMDGIGLGRADQFNGLHMANAPTLKALMKPDSALFRPVFAHGTAVGLPSEDDLGNSEVGHGVLGCGRVIRQGAGLVDDAIASGEIWASPGWQHLRSGWAAGGAFHLLGLLSNGGVHSRTDQLFAVLRRAAEDGARRIYVHPLWDGRDVPDGTSAQFCKELEEQLASIRAASSGRVDARIASGGGRMHITMDRYNADWKMVERGWHTHVLGRARAFPNALTALATFRKENPKVTDQYLPAFVVADPKTGEPIAPIRDGDSVLTFNFRGDRMIEICRAFEEGVTEFKEFDRVRVPQRLKFAGMMPYDGDLGIPKVFLVGPPKIARTSSEFLAKSGVRVFACSETQKFGHVTYFWNGSRSGKFDEKLETYHEIPSDPTSEFVAKPEMKAAEIAAATEAALRSGKFDVCRINLANGDMVGHTGNLEATIKACESVDRAVAQLIKAVNDVGGRFLITADHGNADDMVIRDKKGKPQKTSAGRWEPRTSHTLAPVPVIIGGSGLPKGLGLRRDLPKAGLANLTATYLNLLGFDAPSDYEPSLLVRSGASKL